MKLLRLTLLTTCLVIAGMLWHIETAQAGCCRIGQEGGPQSYTFAASHAACVALNGNQNQNVVYEENSSPAPDKMSCITGSSSTTTTEEAKTSPIEAPSLSVSIPGFGKFSEVKCSEPGDSCEIPWLAEYISAIFDYSVLIIGILAAIVVMLGGVIWLTSAGNQARVNEGKNFVKAGILGITLMVCAYMVLFIINPDLTTLGSLNINYLGKTDLPELDLSKSAEELGITQSQLDNLRGQNPYQAGCGDIAKCRQFGSTKPPGLVKVDPKYGNVYVKAEIYEAFKKALACVNPNQVAFKITDGWRSAEAQIDVKKRKPTLAANPCCSNHGSGSAMDLSTGSGGQMSWSYNDSSGLKRCMNQNGLYANLDGKQSKKNEPWHWSPTGR